MHLVPVVYQRRLLLFWFMLDETGSDEEEADPSSWYSIRMAWSEYRGGKWQPKNEAEATLSLENAWTGSNNDAGVARASLRARTRFHFLSSEDEGGALVLRCICWHPGARAWYEIGSYEMDPCTLAVSATETSSEVLTGDYAATILDPRPLEAVESVNWAMLDGDARAEIMGTGIPAEWEDREYEDLSSEELALFRGYLSTLFPTLYTSSETGAPVPASRLDRVEGTFEAPGYFGYTEDGGGDHLTVYSGDWDETTLEAQAGGETEVKLLSSIISESCVVLPTQVADFVSQVPFFVEADGRSYFVVREIDEVTRSFTVEAQTAVLDQVAEGAFGLALDAAAESNPQEGGLPEDALPSNERRYTALGDYRFDNFFHPYVCSFIAEVRRNGIASLLDPSETGSVYDLSRQQREEEYFDDAYSPTSRVKKPYPIHEIDFSNAGAYALYNWELFFHLPFYVANRLTDNQRFEDALRWYSFIFDPLNRPKAGSAWQAAPGRFWKVKPFLEPVTAPVTSWIEFSGAGGDSDAADAFERQVEEWRDDPFNPHLLARLRPGTYQKAVVMRFIDNLVQWGDLLFTRDTIESINEATQLYMLAKEVLGDRPEKLKRPTAPVEKTFLDLRESGLDAFSNASEASTAYSITSPVIWLEGLSSAARWSPFSAARTGTYRWRTAEPTPTVGGDTYFCIPPNPKLLAYWDTVDDRLFKIRNSLNIEGVFRTLPLYEPPIDPALLVRASALGVDVASVVSGLGTPLPFHRFAAMLPRAQALAASVKALGGALLSALEKRDAEALALLRSSHEISLLEVVRQSKEKAIEEARENLAATKQARKTAESRRDYYKNLLAKGWSAEETKAALLQVDATQYETTSGVVSSLASVLGAFPDLFVSPLLSHPRHFYLRLSRAVSHLQRPRAAANPEPSARQWVNAWDRSR